MLSLPMPSDAAARIARLAREATADSAAERQILGAQAIFVACGGSAPASEVLSLSRQSLEGGGVARELGTGAGYDSAIEALIVCDAHDEAQRHLDQAARHARRHGAPAAAALISANRSCNAWLRGALDDALKRAAEVAAHLAEVGPDAYVSAVAGGAVCGALLLRGELDAAESTARGLEHPRLRQHALGRVAGARGAHDVAAEHLGSAQQTLDRRRLWRSAGPLRPVAPDLARSLAEIGERDQARRLVATELEVARRFGAASCIAEALRAQAAVEDDPEPLRQAARIIKGSEARLVEAAVLLDLGRMTGDAATLERALAIAERCGARALADAARLAASCSDRQEV